MILPRCFFDITINGVPSGRIVFELFSDVCPKTCENFRCLCTGEKGEGKTTFKPLHYSGTPIHRIVKGFIVQGGDFSSGDGTGGESIYGGMFKDENFKLKHDSPFLLSMANKGANSNGSQFFITTRPATHLDGIHVVFGRVVSGQQYVNEIESQKVDANHRPYADVRISNSGELVLLKGGKSRRAKVELSTDSSSQESSSSSSEESSSSESSSSSEEELKKKRKRRRRGKPAVEKVDSSKKRGKRVKKRTRKGRKKKQQSSDSESPDSGQPNAPPEAMVTSTVTEEDLPPEIVSTSRSWLYRYSRSPSPKDKPTSDTEGKKTTRPNRLPETGFKHRSNEVSQSGRKLKGRGLMRYRTPPRFIEHGGYERRWKSPPRRFRSRSRERGRYSPFRDRGRARSASPSPRRRSHRRRSHSSDSQGQSHRRKDRNRSVGVERERSPYSKDLERGPSDLDIGSKALKERVGKRSRRRSKQRSSGEDEARSRYLESPHGGHNRGRSPRKGKESEHDRPRQSSRKYTTPSPDKHQTSDHEKSPRDRQERRRSRDRKERKRRRSESLDAKRSRMYGKRSQKSPQQPSKWDRHFDSSSNSSEEEDQKLERAFQHGHRGGSGSGSEDVFGIAELSKQYFS